MNNDAVRELLNAVGALAEMSLNFYRALLTRSREQGGHQRRLVVR